MVNVKKCEDPRYQYYTFAIDSSSDLSKLPTMTTAGKDALSGISKCCQGSYAEGTDGSVYTLKGDTNTWIVYGGE